MIDKAINLMQDTEGDSDDEGLEDKDSGVNIKFQAVEQRGLSELTRQCFGKPLNKGEQMSDWERRPLRNTQIQYAGKISVYNVCRLHLYLNTSLLRYGGTCMCYHSKFYQNVQSFYSVFQKIFRLTPTENIVDVFDSHI